MNSLECLLSILIERDGGPANTIKRYSNEEVVEASRSLYFAKITGSFLVHVLSYTHLVDTKSVIITCMAWYRASREQAFWRKRIELC